MAAAPHRHSLTRDLLFAVAPLGVGGVLTLGWSIMSVRVFGASAFGQLALGIALGNLLRTVAVLGLDRAIITPIAQARQHGLWRDGSRLAARAMALVAAVVGTIIIAGWALHGMAAAQLEAAGYSGTVLTIGLLTAVSGSTMSMAAGISLGAGRFRELISSRQVAIRGIQASAVAVVGVLAARDVVAPGLGLLATIYVGAELLGALVLAARSIQSLRPAPGSGSPGRRAPEEAPCLNLRSTLARGMPVTAQAAASALCSDGSRLLLAAYGAPPEAVGAFTVMLQIASFSAMGYSTVVQAAMAHGARAVAEGDVKTLERDYALVTMVGTIPAAMLLSLSMCAGDMLLQPWGLDQLNYQWPMVVIAIAQVLDVILGPTGTALTVAQHSAALTRSAIGSALAFVAGGIALVPSFGLAGAGLTIALSRLIRHGICIRQLQARLGLSVPRRRIATILGCAAVATAAGWAVTALPDAQPTWSIIVCVVTYATSIGWTLRYELTADISTRR